MGGGGANNPLRGRFAQYNRRATRLLFAATILLAPVFLAPTEAGAQTSQTLVSNTGQSSDSGPRRLTHNDSWSQSFQTGSNAEGYSLDNIGLLLDRTAPGIDPLDFTVSLWADSSDRPSGAAALATLSHPDPISDGVNAFTAPTGTTLAADTKYHVVLSQTVTTGTVSWERMTTSNGLDEGAAEGWSISDSYLRRVSGGSWSVHSATRSLQLQVVGSPLAVQVSVAVPSGGETVDTGENVVFDLTRTGNTNEALAATVSWTGTDGLANTSPSTTVNFAEMSADAQVTLTSATLAAGTPAVTVMLTVEAAEGYEAGDPASASVLVRPQNSPASGEPSIDGAVAQVGVELTAGVGTITDADGTPVLADLGFVWEREDPVGTWTPIPSETSGTYTLQAADQDKKVRVVASWTDAAGHDETRTSDAFPSTGAVVAAPVVTVTRQKSPVISTPGNREDTVFILARTGPTATALTVNIRVSGSAAQTTVINANTRAIIPMGSATREVTLEPRALDTGDSDTMMTLTIEDPGDGRYTVGAESSATVTVTEGVAVQLTIVSIAPPSPATVAEGGDAVFTMTLSGPAHTVPFSFRWSLVTSGTFPGNAPAATAADIATTEGSVSFAVGDTMETFTIRVRTDDVDEGNETLRIVLSSSSDPINVALPHATDIRADVTITNVAPASDAVPEVTVAPRSGGGRVVGGSGGPAVFVISRTGDTGSSLDVEFTMEGDAAAYATPGSRPDSETIPIGASMVEVSVPTAEQQVGNEPPMTLTIDAPSDGSYTVGAMSSASVTVTPRTNRPATGEPAITGMARVGQELMAGPGNIADPDTLNVLRYRYQWRRVDADGVSNPVDVGTDSSTYTLAPADAGKRIRVTLSFQDSLGNNEMRTSDAWPASGTVEEEAAALPEITVAAGAASVVGGENAVFTLTRTGDPAATLDVDITVSGAGALASEITAKTSATFAANSATTEVSVRTNAITSGGNQLVTLTVVDGATYDLGTPAMASVTTTAPAAVMPDPPTVTVAASAASVVGGSAGPAVFTLTRSEASATALPVTFAISGTHTVSSPPTTASIPAMMTTVDVTVPTTAITGANETVILTIQADSGNAYTVGSANTATVMVTAPPIPEVTVAASAASVVGGNAAVFTLNRSEASVDALPVTFAISGTHTVSNAPTTATIPADMTTVDVSVATTEITGADETVILTIQADSGNAYTVGSANTATVMVTAPPIPEVTVAAPATRVIGGNDAVFTLRRTEDPAAALTVDITVSGDGALASEITAKTEATFAANSETAAVSVQTNTIEEGENNQMVTLTIDDSDDGSYTVGAAGSAMVTVTAFDAEAQGARVSEVTDHSLALLAPNVATNTVQVLTARFDNIGAGAPGSSLNAAKLGGRPLGAFAGSGASAAKLTREVASLFGLHLPASGASGAAMARTDAGAGSGASPTETGVPGVQGAFEAPGMAAHSFDAHNADAHVGLGRSAGDIGNTDDWRAFEPGRLHRPDLRGLLAQSEFSVTFGAAHGAHGRAGGGPAWTVWGRGAAGGFEGTEKDSALDVEGESVSAYLGADVQLGHLALGLAVGQSEGELDYAGGAEASSGELETELTSVHPYLHWSGREDISLYAMLGVGFGEATLTDAELDESGLDALESDLEMQMLAVGMRRALAASGAGLRYEVKLDAFWVDLESDGVSAQDGGVPWQAVDTQSSRVRLALAGALPLMPESGGSLLAEGELAARLDGGDAQTGLGAEIGAGLTWMQGGFSLAAKGRVLLVHSEGEFEDYEEWGASLAASYRASGMMGRGLRFTLSPAWGETGSGVDALYESADALRELGDGSGRDDAGRRSNNDRLLPDRLDFELGYGLAALGGRAELLPFGRFSLADGDAETRLRLGTRFNLPHTPGDALPVHRLGLELFGETQAGNARERLVGLELNLGF